MSERREAILREPQQAKQALDWLYAQAKPWLIAGHELVVTLGPKKQERRHVKHYPRQKFRELVKERANV